MKIAAKFTSPSWCAAGAFLLTQIVLLVGTAADKGVVFPLALAVLAAGLYALWRRRDLAPLMGLTDRTIFWAYYLVFLIAWLVLIAINYYAFEYANFDTGVFANLLANLWYRGRYVSSVLGVHGLGDHFSPAFMLCAPLLGVKESFLWLPLLKVVAFFACPLILHRLGREILGKQSRLLYVAPLLWIINQYASRSLDAEFQPSSLALPFVLLAFLWAVRRCWLRVWLTLVLLACFKEHLPLIWVSLGIFCIFAGGSSGVIPTDGKRLTLSIHGAVMIITGVLVGLLIYLVAMPYYAAGHPAPHAGRFAPFALLLPKVFMLCKVLASVGFVPLLAPWTMLFVIPAFGIQLISGAPTMIELTFHYQDVAMAVLFVAVIVGLRNARDGWFSRLGEQKRHAMVLACALLLIGLNSRYPMYLIRHRWPTSEHLTLLDEVEVVRTEVRRSEVERLWALDALGPYFFFHPGLRSILTPEEPFSGDASAIILAAPLVKSYPLTNEERQLLLTRIEGASIPEAPPFRLLRVGGRDSGRTIFTGLR